MEALGDQTVFWQHVERTAEVLLHKILAMLLVMMIPGVVVILEEGGEVFINLAPLECTCGPRSGWVFTRCTEGETGESRRLQLVKDQVVRSGRGVDLIPHYDHDEHGKDGAYDLEERAEGPPPPVDEVFLHERPEMTQSRCHLV